MNPNAKGTTHVVTEGSTKPYDIQILEARAEKDFAGINVDIEWNADIDPTDVSGVSVAWLDQTLGTVRVEGLDGLAIGKYGFRFTLTAGSDTGHAPNGLDRDFFQVVGV